MNSVNQPLPKQELPIRWQRELQKGETVYHSTMACHVSKKHPQGKWIAQVHRETAGRIQRLPVKGFGTIKEAVDYVKALRTSQSGSGRRGEPTVADLYTYVMAHRQKRLSEKSRQAKVQRWRDYIAPEWGNMPLSKVTRRSAQEWISSVEEGIVEGLDGIPSLNTLDKVQNDLHAMFEGLGAFDAAYDDRRNPFADLIMTPLAPRAKVTIESQHFPAIHFACEYLATHGFCTDWIVTMFEISLFSGLRKGEVMALCTDQCDFTNGGILIDRALRSLAREIDPLSRQELGSVKPQCMNFPKGGKPNLDKSRLVPMTGLVSDLLQDAIERKGRKLGKWDLLWPSALGELRDLSHFKSAWKTLQARLHELATLAPLEPESDDWPEYPKRRGWRRNPLIEMARADKRLRVPNIFGNMDFRDTRNSFASYANEVLIPQATREALLGHGGIGVTNTRYTVVTSNAFQDSLLRLSNGWSPLSLSDLDVANVA